MSLEGVQAVEANTRFAQAHRPLYGQLQVAEYMRRRSCACTSNGFSKYYWVSGKEGEGNRIVARDLSLVEHFPKTLDVLGRKSPRYFAGRCCHSISGRQIAVYL